MTVEQIIGEGLAVHRPEVDAKARRARVGSLLEEVGMPADASFDVRDRVTGARWTWGRDAWVRLDPLVEPVHLLEVVPGSVRG